MQKAYIVTGGNGHLGNTIIKLLCLKNEFVRCLVLPNEIAVGIEGLPVEIIYGDVRISDSLDPLFVGLEAFEVIVIHTAGIVSIKSEFNKDVYDVNVQGTMNIVNKCEQYSVKRLIYVSSVHAIPEEKAGNIICETVDFSKENVIGAYAKTKAEATAYVLKHAQMGLDCVIVHPSGICGPNDFGNGHMTQLVMDYLDGRLVACINGGYDFVDVRDVADGIIAAMELGKRGECYILSNRYYDVPELLNLLAEVSGKRKIKVILPLWFVNLSAPLSEYWYKLRKQTPLYTKYSLFTLASNSDFSHQKADQVLGYKTRDMKDTLRDTVRFLCDTRRLKNSAYCEEFYQRTGE